MAALASVAAQDEVVRFGPFQFSAARRQLLLDGQPVSLGSRSFSLLLALVQQAGEVLSKDALMRAVWPDSVVEDSNLRVHMAALRKALGVPADGGQYILNIPLRGYSFVARWSGCIRPGPLPRRGMRRRGSRWPGSLPR